MINIKTEITINAPKAKVWSVLTGFADYNRWSKVITDMNGYPQKGKTLTLTVHPLPGVGLPIPECEITVCSEEKGELRWQGPSIPVVKDVISANHYFYVESISENKTRFIHCEDFDGWITPVLKPLLEAQLPELYAEFNKELKAEAEK
ncbi:MAG: SRPBCC domain-containing protein [Leptospiraceae bacterium]|nr:SRPBCC domain-containing protein [Leptospiraceae bacterium]MCB1200828.1 SRPBCC domain-containing protein [Leptospiraceae bacterium]